MAACRSFSTWMGIGERWTPPWPGTAQIAFNQGYYSACLLIGSHCTAATHPCTCCCTALLARGCITIFMLSHGTNIAQLLHVIILSCYRVVALHVQHAGHTPTDQSQG